jgi:hypothetical protein
MRTQKLRRLVFVALTNLRHIQLWRLSRAFILDTIEITEYCVEQLDSKEGFGTLSFLLNSTPQALVGSARLTRVCGSTAA